MTQEIRPVVIHNAILRNRLKSHSILDKTIQNLNRVIFRVRLYVNSNKNGYIRDKKISHMEKFSKHMNINAKTRRKMGKRVRPHPFLRQKFAISLANIYV